MPCFLCAHLSKDLPEIPNPLHPSHAAWVNEPLGTCANCSVWACSQHASKYSLYICASCQPALAIAGALGGGPPANAAEAIAQGAGRSTSSAVVARAREAIATLTRSRRFAVDAAGPDLVTDYADAVRHRLSYGRGLQAVPGDDERLDHVAAEIRGEFAGRELHPDDESAVTVAGALVQAMEVADPGSGGEIRPPWEVEHPELLAPALWLMTTAYALAARDEVEPA